MPTIEATTPKFDRVKTNAQTAKLILETKRLSHSYDHNIEQIQRHLDDCNYHPTTGLLARQKYIENAPKIFPGRFIRNKETLKSHPTFQYLNGILEDTLNKLYPKTKKIRQYIIQNNRIDLDYVTRAKGYNLIDKLKIFLR